MSIPEFRNFIREGGSKAEKLLFAGVAGRLEFYPFFKKRMDRPSAYRAMWSSAAVKRDSVKRPFFILPAFTGFKPALYSGLLALTLCFPLTLFPNEIVSDFSHDQTGEHVEELAADNSGRIPKNQSNGKTVNKSQSRVRVGGKVNSFFDVLRVHICLIFVKYGFYAGLITGTVMGIYIYFPKIARFISR